MRSSVWRSPDHVRPQEWFFSEWEIIVVWTRCILWKEPTGSDGGLYLECERKRSQVWPPPPVWGLNYLNGRSWIEWWLGRDQELSLGNVKSEILDSHKERSRHNLVKESEVQGRGLKIGMVTEFSPHKCSGNIVPLEALSLRLGDPLVPRVSILHRPPPSLLMSLMRVTISELFSSCCWCLCFSSPSVLATVAARPTVAAIGYTTMPFNKSVDSVG